MSLGKVVVFMKGTKVAPQCGFSNQVVSILTSVSFLERFNPAFFLEVLFH